MLTTEALTTSFSVVAELAAEDPRIKGIKLSRNFGKEGALLAALERAGGEAIITIDSDLQHPPARIPEFVKLWKDGASVVHGVKLDRSDGRLARWRAALANGLITRLSGFDMRNASDFKLLDRAAVDVVVLCLRERRRFYRGLTEWIGFESEDVYFDVATRRSGSSNWSFFGLLSLTATAIVSFSSAPLRIVTLLGFATLVLGGVIGAEALWSWFTGSAASGFATIISTLLMIGSVIMISLGIIGEYVGNIYDEVKSRPHYVIDKTTAGLELCHRSSASGSLEYPKNGSGTQ